MRADASVLLTDVRRSMRANWPPQEITQEAFDFDRGHLVRLTRLEAGQRAQADDLWSYSHDLRYTQIDPNLFRYLLPMCLSAWRDDLRGAAGYGGFVEHFYPVLADRGVFETLLTVEQTAAVSEFMRQSILDEMDEQRGLAYRGAHARPYRWIRALTTYGVLLPDIDRLWSSWWALGTVGRAVSAMQYVSALMYADHLNAVFAPWTPDAGGGPPCLWEFEGHLYSHRWLESNVDFLRQALNPPAATNLLRRALTEMTAEPEYETALRIMEDVPERLAMLTARCQELPNLLATTQQPGTLLTWSTER